MDYDLEIEKIVKEIKAQKAKLVLLQFPDGLKPSAKKVQDELKQKTDAKILLWGGSCFGACDVPVEVERLNVDLIVTFGHSVWRY
ncbi:diphthamide synthesis protein [Candidatus Woesearchaeota archaeon]|nr:diphthamide synthesis protein [Candidatus Woesearchaeota archaeon]